MNFFSVIVPSDKSCFSEKNLVETQKIAYNNRRSLERFNNE